MPNWTETLEELGKKWKSIINSTDWTVAKETPKVTVWSKLATDWHGTIYKTEGIIDAEPEVVFRYVDPFPEGGRDKWDPTVKERVVVESISEDTKVLRSTTHSAAMGIISPRDFIDIITKSKDENGFYTRGTGIEHPNCPVSSSTVRGFNHTCGIMCQRMPDEPKKTKLTTVIQTNLCGMIPKAIVDGVLPGSQIDFFNTLHKVLKNDGKLNG